MLSSHAYRVNLAVLHRNSNENDNKFYIHTYKLAITEEIRPQSALELKQKQDTSRNKPSCVAQLVQNGHHDSNTKKFDRGFV